MTVTERRGLRGTFDLAQTGIGPEDARRSRLVAGSALARIDSKTKAAFGIAQGAKAIERQLTGAQAGAFLIARDTSGDPGFQARRGASVAVRRDLGFAGVTLSAESDGTGTDTLIIFDSANPTGGDGDLQTPGPGANNDEALGNLLIIAENTVDGDGDGLVDVPDDEENGGTIVIDFDRPVTMCALGLLDLDKGGIGSVIRFLDDAETEAGERYRVAHRLAARYVALLEERFVETGELSAMLLELRRFYRRGLRGKVEAASAT